MRWLTLLVMLAGCSSSTSEGWGQAVVEFPTGTGEVVEAVAALPECDRIREGGMIHWRLGLFTCRDRPAEGCSYPFERPPLVEVVLSGSAWSGVDGVSTLAHELCHVCGYLVEAEANACAMRARELSRR
jgi:hypothetical protein